MYAPLHTHSWTITYISQVHFVSPYIQSFSSTPSLMCVRGGGAPTLESGMGISCPQQDTLFLIIFFVPETHHFKSFFSSRDSTHIFEGKKTKKKQKHFQAKFSLIKSIFQHQRYNFFFFFAKICSQDPSFKLKNLFCRPYFWKPVHHIPTKMIWTISPWVSHSPSPYLLLDQHLHFSGTFCELPTIQSLSSTPSLMCVFPHRILPCMIHLQNKTILTFQ